jgi:hypothetical protein
MPTIQELEARRDAVLNEMRSIRSMTRGTINEQFLEVYRKRVKKSVALGPYYVFSRHDPAEGKTRSRRLTCKEEVERVRGEIASHQRFAALCRQFEHLTERLGELEREVPAQGAEKKRHRLPSSRKQK